MLTKLLSLPERKMTIGPELIRFFQHNFSDKWAETLNEFLKTFAGTSFEIPGPSFLASIKADKEIIRSLRSDQSIQNRVSAMEDHGVSYNHMVRIWQVVEGKMLPAPKITGRNNAVDEAAILIRRHPKLECDIAQMYALTSKERVTVMEMVVEMRQARTYKPLEQKKEPKKMAKKTPKPVRPEDIVVPKRVTAAQRKFIAALKANGGPLSPDDMKKVIGTIKPTKTIKALVEQGLVRQTKRGQLSLTAKGKKAA